MRQLLIGMSIEVAVFMAVLLGTSILLYFPGRPLIAPVIERVQQIFNPPARPAPTPAPGDRHETTARPGRYACADGKSFTLTVQADGTARVIGASSGGVVLRRTTGTAIWASADGRVAVREIADYTVLIENDVTTRDRCRVQ
jgi:hypothetical protein